MSFTSTPLGSNQNRRVDRNTFFNKPSQSLIPPTRSIPTSYSYGAPSITRSPPKHTQSTHDQDNPDEPALVRFAKQKERANPSNIDPEGWSVRDTSVRIANALSQAATGDTSMPPTNPNDSWASGATRKSNLPRSTSVEYEKETQSTTIRRLNAPPPSNRGPPHRQIVKTTSIQHVPDSEEDDSPPVSYARGKSPFEHVADVARSVLKPATFFMVRRSQEPEDLNGKDSSSYDYADEEQEYQDQQAPTQAKPLSKRNTHKRGRISVDNKAYRPSVSDLELSDEEFEDDDKKIRRRKKNKRDSIGGPLTNLPVAGYDKRRKRKKNAKGGEEEGDEEDEEESGSDEPEKVSEHRTSAQRGSAPRTLGPLSLRTSVPRDSAQLDHYDQNAEGDTSMDIEQGLNSIPEVDESFDAEFDHTLPSTPPASFSIGGLLGRIVNLIIRSILTLFSSVFRLLGYITWALGQLLAVTFKTPMNLFNIASLARLTKATVTVIAIYFVWHLLRDNSEIFRIPTISWSSPPRAPYHPPSVPASDFAELSARLQAFESALSSLSLEHERAKLRLENELNRGNSDFSGRLGALEMKVQKEGAKALEAESQFRQSAGRVKQEIDTLRSQIASVPPKSDNEGTDEEARTQLKHLEERIGSVEGGLKDALELGKNSVKVGTSAGVAAWWNKLATGNLGSTLTIKSSDGQDVTSLITHLVDSVTSKYTKDLLVRPDLALHSGGAQVIPSLTSPTYEIRPSGAANQIIGFVTGSGHAVGRPPVTALHHDINNGHCWPFAGSQGQLGVKLAWPALISDVTIDHVAKDVAFDMRSAPREMELWGLVEGRDNIGKLKTWLAEQQMKRDEDLAAGLPIRQEDEEWVYPRGLPRNLPYARIASFTYDIRSPNNVQTYPASQDIRDLGIDFGLVVLFVKNNWGRDEFTCIYRLRVHGQRIGEVPPPYDPESEAS